MRKIADVAADLGLTPDEYNVFGSWAAKLTPASAFRQDPLPEASRLVLVSAINPTPAGEGKTTVTIGLTQAARKLGIRAAAALRQPSQGPVFGVKGGGTGGGQATLVPLERINLHFTGDIHAVTAAHNLLAALADNDCYFGGGKLDPRQITWRRSMDMNERFLRKIVIGLGGKSGGLPRETAFDITAASEVMAILCLSRDYADLKRRLGEIIVGHGPGGVVRARDLRAEGSMAVLLRDALLPNIAQTIEGAPVFVHGGPFGNIAHGCNSILATKAALRHSDLVFTEGGFGFDLGAEKFLNIKCRAGGIWPNTVVLVATVRALKMHGGASLAEMTDRNPAALERGMANLDKHIESVRAFGLEPTVALNIRHDDPSGEADRVVDMLKERGVDAGFADVYSNGGAGALELAEKVAHKARTLKPRPKFLYASSDAPEEKIEKVARAVYGAKGVEFSPTAKSQLAKAVALGYGDFPVCMAKTHLSLSDDPKKICRPRDFTVNVREVRISAGAGFLVCLTGEIMTMPGLPKVPHSEDIDLTADGEIIGVK
ncbi:MAG: formate--tetrahydrofolate ligase [Fibrobacteria bacterium]